MIKTDKEKGINSLIKSLNKSFFNTNFFIDNFNLKTQQDVNNFIKDNDIKTPELKIYLYDYFIENMHNLIDSMEIKKDEFILINDSTISTIIKDYFILLMFNEINDKITDTFYDNIKHEKIEEENDYYKEFKKVKNNLKYFNKFKKVYNSNEFPLKIIETVNKNISEDNYDILTTAIKSYFDKIKNEN